MKLSQERQILIEKKVENRLAELARKSDREIDDLKRERYLPDQIRMINNKHIEQMQAITDYFMELNLDAYQADNESLAGNDIVEIILRLTGLVNEETQKRDSKLSDMHPLANATEQAIRDILSGARLTLETAAAEAEHEAKRKDEARMNQRLMLERDQKRYRVLKRIFEESGGNTIVPVSEETISEKEGIPAEELAVIARYLMNEGLIKFYTFGNLAIEHLGVREMETSIKNPNQNTEHFQSTTIIQHFHEAVHNVQTGNQNTQNVVININPAFNEAISQLVELIHGSNLDEVKKEDAIEALERLPKLAQKDKSPDVIEAATKRLNLLKMSFDVVKLAAQAGPYLQYLYHWFQK